MCLSCVCWQIALLGAMGTSLVLLIAASSEAARFCGVRMVAEILSMNLHTEESHYAINR